MLVLAMQFSRITWRNASGRPIELLLSKLGSRTAGITLPERDELPHNGTEMCRCIASPGSREN